MPKKFTHAPLDTITLSFDVPGPTIVALYNAMGFTLSHRELYKKEADDCQHCFDAMENMATYFFNLIESTEGKKMPKKRTN